jgi:hypothetical protein
MMDDHGKSHNSIVPEKSPNNARKAAEGVEGRGLAKGKTREQNMLRTQSREGVQSGLPGDIERNCMQASYQKCSASYDSFPFRFTNA